MRKVASLFWTLLLLLGIAAIAWFSGLDNVVRTSVAAGHLLDWVMGALCLLWLIVILKAPWDLYFQAHEVAFELQRSREREIAIAPGREDYIRALRKRLLWLALGAHLLSALVIVLVTYFAGGAVGYYFAGFYLVSTAFRPGVAGYVFLSEKLRSIGREVRYPREDVELVRQKLKWLELSAYRSEKPGDEATYAWVGSAPRQLEELKEQLEEETEARTEEMREIRERVHALGREFEITISRLTDNQEVIKGIQAFVRLVAQSTQS